MALYRFAGQAPVVGAKTYVSELAAVIGAVEIADQCYIGHGVILRGDYGKIVIGPGTAVEEGVIIHASPQGLCRIGNRVTFGHGAIVHAEEVEDYAVIGMGAVLSLRCRVGEWAIVAEGSVVKARQSVPARVVVTGAPAKIVRPLEDRDVKFWTWGKQLYVDLAQQYLTEGMERLD